MCIFVDLSYISQKRTSTVEEICDQEKWITDSTNTWELPAIIIHVDASDISWKTNSWRINTFSQRTLIEKDHLIMPLEIEEDLVCTQTPSKRLYKSTSKILRQLYSCLNTCKSEIASVYSIIHPTSKGPLASEQPLISGSFRRKMN